jgi:phosphatidate cytidylyltransferase
VDSKPPSSGGRNLPVAIVTALILLGLIALCFALGPDAFFVLALVVVSMALYEAVDMAREKGHRVIPLFGVAAGAAMLFTAYFWRPAYISGILALTLLGTALLAMRPERGPQPASDIAWTMFAVAWVGGGGAGAVSILRLNEIGLELLVTTVLLIAIADIGAFFAGTSFGRHKMAPSISPAKSWEGFVGGLCLALAGGLAAGTILDELTVAQAMGLAFVGATVGPVGDLLESMVKRQMGVKDSGRLLPGHGGMLDRLDAIAFACPFAYLYLRVVVL